MSVKRNLWTYPLRMQTDLYVVWTSNVGAWDHTAPMHSCSQMDSMDVWWCHQSASAHPRIALLSPLLIHWEEKESLSDTSVHGIVFPSSTAVILPQKGESKPFLRTFHAFIWAKVLPFSLIKRSVYINFHIYYVINFYSATLRTLIFLGEATGA
jgi:hypothetical protein